MRQSELRVFAPLCCLLTKGGRQHPCLKTWLLPLLLLSSLQESTIAVTINLTPKSFDDQYQGCSQQIMKELNEGDYFTKELEVNKNYSKIWQNAHLKWLNQQKNLPQNMTDTHAVAILVYILNNNIHSDFSRAMASLGTSTAQYHHDFHFKYLHYYLTSAIQLLREDLLSHNIHHCYEVHYESKDVSLKVPIGTIIRFGQFLSTSLLRNKAQNSKNKTFFTISTCLGVPVDYFSLKEEVLIPPYELFEVVNMSLLPRGNWVQLQSIGNVSTYNCQLLKASSTERLPVPVTIASLSFLSIILISFKN